MFLPSFALSPCNPPSPDPITNQRCLRNEIVHLVAQKTALSEEEAQQATEVVISYLKGKLPEPPAAQLGHFAGSRGADCPGGDVLNRLFGEQAS